MLSSTVVGQLWNSEWVEFDAIEESDIAPPNRVVSYTSTGDEILSNFGRIGLSK